MDDDEFLKDGLLYYGEAFAAIVAFRMRFGDRLVAILKGRQFPSAKKKHSQDADGYWVYANTDGVLKAADNKTVYLQVGVWFPKDDLRGTFYAAYMLEAVVNSPLAVAAKPGKEFKLQAYGKGHLLLAPVAEAPVDSQVKGLLEELARLVPGVHRR